LEYGENNVIELLVTKRLFTA